MKNLIICISLFMLFISDFQIKAEEYSVRLNENVAAVDNQITMQDYNLNTSLVWDKNKPPKKQQVNNNDFGKQLWKNLHLGWDIDKEDNYRWRNFALGTGYTRNFQSEPRAYWFIGGNFNWSKYTLYHDGDYRMGANDAIIKTFSISVPAYVGYNIHQNRFTGMGWKVYTGPTLELITSAKLDGYPYRDFNPIQAGWTIGTGFRLFHILGFNVAYNYYPTAVLSDGNLVRSSVNFTLGF